MINRRIFSAFFIVMALSTLLSCGEKCLPGEDCYEGEDEEEDCDPAPWDCDRTPPSRGRLLVKLSGDDAVPYVVYKGPDIETGSIIAEGAGSGRVLIDSSATLGEYSALATYTLEHDGKVYTIEAVDGGTLSYDSEDYCDGEKCYSEESLELNLTFDEQGFKDFLDNKEARCFIASAVYGPRSEPVRYLRGFRDSVLLRHAPGKLLVRLYYAYSPNVAVFIRRHQTVVPPARAALDGLIFTLRNPFLILFSVMLYGVIAAGALHLAGRKS
jgi:hypothetical protein